MAWFALHLPQVLFTLARDLFNCGLVCLAFSPGVVYFGWGLFLIWAWFALRLAQVLFILSRDLFTFG